MRIDYLWLAALERLDVAHHLHRKADARSDMNAAAPRRRQPLGFPRRKVEHVHDRARNAENFAQRLYGRRRDDLGRFRRSDRMVDFMQDAQPPGVLVVRFDEPSVKSAVFQQQHQQHQTRCHQAVDSSRRKNPDRIGRR